MSIMKFLALFVFLVLLCIIGCDNSSTSIPDEEDSETISESSEENRHSSAEKTSAEPNVQAKKEKGTSNNKEAENSPRETNNGGRNAQSGKQKEAAKDAASEKWFSTEIKKSYPVTELEIWNQILSHLKKLLVAEKIIFLPLGASFTSLTHLSENRYKLTGRCILIEKSGNQIRYDFECTAWTNSYQTIIISTRFYSQH